MRGMDEKMIKCQHDDCGYKWKSKVKEKKYVTCPSCIRKTKRC